MNTFCEYIKDEIKKEFNFPVDVFVSRKEKLVNFAFESFFSFYDELIRFVYVKWEQRRFLMSYEMAYPRLITSLRWKFDYVFFSEWKMQKCEHELLERLVDEFLSVIKEKYSERYYHLQIAKSKSKSIYFVIYIFLSFANFYNNTKIQ